MDCRDAKVGIVPLTQSSDGKAPQKTRPTGQFNGRIVAMTRALAAARVANTIRRILMQDSALAFLKNEGILHAEFLFKNAVMNPFYQLPRSWQLCPCSAKKIGRFPLIWRH